MINDIEMFNVTNGVNVLAKAFEHAQHFVHNIVPPLDNVTVAMINICILIVKCIQLYCPINIVVNIVIVLYIFCCHHVYIYRQ